MGFKSSNFIKILYCINVNWTQLSNRTLSTKDFNTNLVKTQVLAKVELNLNQKSILKNWTLEL